MAFPATKLRSSIKTLLGSVTYTKTSGEETAPYFEQHPGHRAHFPYILYSNCFIGPDDAKGCQGWDPLVIIETVTGGTPGHTKKDWADEIEGQIVTLMTARPYALNLSPTYALIFSRLETSQYLPDEFINPDKSKPNKQGLHIIRKLTQFRLNLQEL